MKIRAGDGCEEMGHPEMLSTLLFCLANPGDRLALSDKAYMFNVATYRPMVEQKWLYTYDYAPDQSWTIYNRDLSGDSYRQQDYIFSDRVFFRVCLRKVSGEAFDGSEDINQILEFNAEPVQRETKLWIFPEAGLVINRVKEASKQGDKRFILITDTHYNVNGTWDDTMQAIRLLNDELKLDGIIHLGDMSDGMVTGEATRHYVGIMMRDMKSLGIPVWITLGNHDSNYFRKNPDPFTPEQQRELYFNGGDARYHIDLPGLRLIFLDSFNPNEELRYGYTVECAIWLESVLNNTPVDSKALIFSHLPPFARLQFWTKELRGEKEITEILDRHKDRLKAWINGHNHADRLDNNEGYPIVSIANAKCEAFTERKTEGFVTPNRKLNDVTQEAFDILTVNAGKKTAGFTRFGAGRDRIIAEGRVEWV
jgi:hypothetical protein